ncbi:hypothetical protein Glove_152g105 [Diversispora epigaea]|uniref:Uncharacterized protein n=1 Tax=Diversispora epigaea TaxID=1348612 RepID=A0A397ISZ3_9GLOM|nr:hypothetical protein Glove_152g105 [Diversispora epigaea]
MQFGIEESNIEIVGVNRTTFSPNLYIDQLSEILKLDLPVELLNMQLVIFKEQWSSKAKQYFRFLSNIENNNSGHTIDSFTSDKEKELAKTLNINENDLPILKFLQKKKIDRN